MYRTTFYGLVALGLIWLPASSAPAQPPGFGPGRGVSASMATSDLRRGLEGVFRAATQSKSSSSAPTSPLVDYQTAKGMSYDNQIKQTKTFFEKRQINTMYRTAERGPRHTQAQYAKIATQGTPERLSSNQFDSYRGAINWPYVLRGSAHQKNRERVNELYARHSAAGGGINTPEYAEIVGLLKEMQKQLRGDLDSITPEQYSYSRKFLEGLRHEARYPAGR